MRVASWAFVLCAALGAVAVFVPSLELRLGGSAVSKRTQRSLHGIAGDRALVRRLLAAYHRSEQRRVGAEIVRSVAPRIGGRTRAALDNARDAMDTLDEVTDDDVRIAGTALSITLWALLALDAIMAALVFSELMRDTCRRGRLIAALAVALLVAATAIALHLACREAAWQANDEVGRTIVALGPGAYLLPLAQLAALGISIALVRRAPRGSAAPGRG